MTWQGWIYFFTISNEKIRQNTWNRAVRYWTSGFIAPQPLRDWEQPQPVLKCLSLLLEGTFQSTLERGGTQREPVISLSGGSRELKSRGPSTRGESCAVRALQVCRGAPRGSHWLLICAHVQENHQRHGEEVYRSRQSRRQNIPRIHRGQCIVSQARVERCHKCCGGWPEEMGALGGG